MDAAAVASAAEALAAKIAAEERELRRKEALADLDKHLRPVRGTDFTIWKRDEELALMLLLFPMQSRTTN